MAPMQLWKSITLLSFALSAFLFVLISAVGAWLYLERTDNIVHWAKEQYVLDTKHIYIIRKNTAVLNDQAEIHIPPDTFYVLTLPGEDMQQQLTSGRKVGSTSVDIASYEGKEVYIDGYFFKGAPMFLKPEHELPMQLRSKDQAVLHIFSLLTEDELRFINDPTMPPPNTK